MFRHCSRYNGSKELFDAFYADYREYEYYINDILNNKLQPGILDTFAKTTESNKTPHEQQETNSELKEWNNEIQSLTDKNGNLKCENKTFLKITKLLSTESQTNLTIKKLTGNNVKIFLGQLLKKRIFRKKLQRIGHSQTSKSVSMFTTKNWF